MVKPHEKRPRGRPKTDDPLLPVMIRLPGELIERVDAFTSTLAASQQSGDVSRSAVIRFLIEHALTNAAATPRQRKEPITAPTPEPQPRKKRLTKLNDDDRREFQGAYRAVGKGRDFVRIHYVRENLGWPSDDFEYVLNALSAEYTIELHGGDPSQLSREEINDSYMMNGTLYLTFSWRKE